MVYPIIFLISTYFTKFISNICTLFYTHTYIEGIVPIWDFQVGTECGTKTGIQRHQLVAPKKKKRRSHQGPLD